MIRLAAVIGAFVVCAASAEAASCRLVPYDYKALREALSLSSNAEVDQRMADLGKTDPVELDTLCKTRREIMRISDPQYRSLVVDQILLDALKREKGESYLSPGERVAVKRKIVAKEMNEKFGMKPPGR